jgi:AraC-like DNA-binding protein
MIDPLTEVVTLLEPRAAASKVVSGAGRWQVRRSEVGDPFYCAIIEGSCRLGIDGRESVVLDAGDFVLIPSTYGFTVGSLAPMTAIDRDAGPVALGHGKFRVGEQDVPHDVLYLVGHCVFGSPDAPLLVSLLPRLVHVRGDPRLATLVQLVGDESRAQRPARDVVLARLLEVLLIEALRSMSGTAASPGLLRGLADERLAGAIRRMHERPAHPWTVAQLAGEAALSRSAFFARFQRAVGIAPMEYLLAWRMALGKDLLRRDEGGVAEVAARVGYGSASAFSVAFTRHVGLPPTHYAREQAARRVSGGDAVDEDASAPLA